MVQINNGVYRAGFSTSQSAYEKVGGPFENKNKFAPTAGSAVRCCILSSSGYAHRLSMLFVTCFPLPMNCTERQACGDVFEGLAHCEEVLSRNRFLCGSRFTEADLRLVPTAVRFDAVYATLFKCSNK